MDGTLFKSLHDYGLIGDYTDDTEPTLISKSITVKLKNEADKDKEDTVVVSHEETVR